MWLLLLLRKGREPVGGRYEAPRGSRTPFERLRRRRDSYQNSGLLALGVVERVLGRSVCGRGRDDVELTSHPFGYRVLLHFDLSVLVVSEGFLLTCGLCDARGVLSLSVGGIRSEVVTYLFRLWLGLGFGLRLWLVTRIFAGDYSPEKTATMAIGSPVATMLIVAEVWPLLHFTKFLPVFGVAVSVRVVPLATSVPLSMVS